MFTNLLIPDPRNPKGNLYIYMQPFVKGLIHLRDVGTMTYDIA